MTYTSVHQWFKNGDHPEDYAKEIIGWKSGEQVVVSSAQQKRDKREGGVVRRYSNPWIKEEQYCAHCGVTMHHHGWIDTITEMQRERTNDPHISDQLRVTGFVVCPGDYVVEKDGKYFPVKVPVFDAFLRAEKSDG